MSTKKDQETPKSGKVPTNGEMYGDLYLRQTLDPLISLVEAVSTDVARDAEKRYGNLDDQVLDALDGLDAVGVDPRYPDPQKRSFYYTGLLGDPTSPESHPVSRQAQELRNSAKIYYDITFADEKSKKIHLDQVRAAAIDLLEDLKPNIGAKFRRVYRNTSGIFTTATEILTNASLTNAFGIADPISKPGWPRSEYDGAGGNLVSKILKAVDDLSVEENGLTDKEKTELNQLSSLQRRAYWGAETIKMVLDDATGRNNWAENNDKLDRLATFAFRWQKEM